MKIIDKRDFKSLKSREKVLLKCYTCGNSFSVAKNAVQAVIANKNKSNRLKYCSRACQTQVQYTGKNIECYHCKRFFYRQANKIKERNFCSQSCSASFNNPTRKITKRSKKEYFCSCGDRKHQDAKFCFKCKQLNTLENNLKKTLKEKTSKGNARVKYATVREIARRVLELSSVEKRCKICDFDICVDVCHIQPISEFDETSFLADVNSLNNLVYLCPNHHKMLDKKLLCIAPIG